MAKRYAVVTAGNKGIGLEICRQLASNGIFVVLTARDSERGLLAVERLVNEDPTLGQHIVFHQLDVTRSSSISSLASFVNSHFGKLDILVNNAGILGAVWRQDVLKTLPFDEPDWDQKINWEEVTVNTHELAEECIKTNYYGSKQMVETFLPLLQLSDSPSIVNVSSTAGQLKMVNNEEAVGVLGDVENLSQGRIEGVLKKFIEDLKQGSLRAKGWPSFSPAYVVAKACLNAYTRIVAKKYAGSVRINCVCPGFVKTDINYRTGHKTPEQGAEGPVMLALSRAGGVSGRFFEETEEAPF